MMRVQASKKRGFTMLEMVIVVAIIGVLAAILTPLVSNYIDEARVAKAQADVKTIGEAISRFEKDVGRYPMWSAANALMQDTSSNVVTLTSGAALPGNNSDAQWTSSSPADADCAGSCVADTLQHQLLTNSANNATIYPTASSLAKPFKWKGPYLDVDISGDPWNHAYLVNIDHCKSTSSSACFVLSAGPDGIIQTPFSILKTNSVTASSDDILYRIK